MRYLVLLLISFNTFASTSFQEAQVIYNKIVTANHIANAPPLILHTDKSVNAAYQGTSTYINQGLLTLCNRDQVAWVLGHELAHYIHQDRDSNYANEYAADKLGSQLMKKAGYNLNRGKLFLLLLPNTYSVDHPKSVDRYRRI